MGIGNDVTATRWGTMVELENISKCIFVYKLVSKYLENLERIPKLASVKPPISHNTDTMGHANIVSGVHTSDHHQAHSQISSSYNQTVRLGHQLRSTYACKKTKGTHISTGPTSSSRHSKTILNYRLCLHQFYY